MSSPYRFLHCIKKWHQKLISPHLLDSSSVRKERIFYILLISNLYLVGAGFIIVGSDFIRYQAQGISFHGVKPLFMLCIWGIMLGLYFLAQRGKMKLSVILYLMLLWISTAYTSFRWGALLSQAVITYALIITFTGILLDYFWATVVTLGTGGYLIILSYLQLRSVFAYDNTWRAAAAHPGNALMISLTLLIISFFTYLTNKEISSALRQAQKSKQLLQKERDLLESKVKKRTKQLRQEQLKTMINWQKFVEVGKISSGLFHDLRNYLTSISLDLEIDQKQQALNNMQRLQILLNSTQKQLRGTTKKEYFSPLKETKQIKQLFRPRLRKNKINLEISSLKIAKSFGPDSLQLYGPISAFHQIMLNLISNAIDATSTAGNSTKKKKILVHFQTTSKDLIIKVTDFGPGIPKKQQKQIFEAFFTTKKSQENFGLGLFLSKNALETHFKGKISLQLNSKKGTTFKTAFPLS